jgi:hypothetical protein
MIRPYDIPISHERVPLAEVRAAPRAAYLVLDDVTGAVLGRFDIPDDPTTLVGLAPDANGALVPEQPPSGAAVPLRRYGDTLTV